MSTCSPPASQPCLRTSSTHMSTPHVPSLSGPTASTKPLSARRASSSRLCWTTTLRIMNTNWSRGTRLSRHWGTPTTANTLNTNNSKTRSRTKRHTYASWEKGKAPWQRTLRHCRTNWLFWRRSTSQVKIPMMPQSRLWRTSTTSSSRHEKTLWKKTSWRTSIWWTTLWSANTETWLKPRPRWWTQWPNCRTSWTRSPANQASKVSTCRLTTMTRCARPRKSSFSWNRRTRRSNSTCRRRSWSRRRSCSG